jgi:hypothetical protein
MSTPIHSMVSGTFTTPATLVPVNIPVPSGFDYIEITNLSDIVTVTNTPAVIVRAQGYASMPAKSSITISGTGAGYGLNTAVNITSGFTFFNDSNSVAFGTPVTNVSSITQASPPVVATANPVANGSVVRMYGTTGMLQISGMDFTTSNYSAGVSFKLAYIDASGFGAAGTAGSFVTIPFDPRFYPRRRFITGITAANPAVVTLSVTHGFVVGEKVRIIVPSAYGMPQINNYLATITAISTTNNTITLDIDSSAFTAFAFPTSAVAAAGVSPALVVPVGEAAINSSTYPYANLLDDATVNQSFGGVQIDTGVLVASKNYSYLARKGQAL